MYNPFEALNARLERIEELVTRLLLNSTPQPQSSEIGGISLAQEITRLSKARIYALVSARAIPSAKRGNRLTFYRSELLAWVAAGKRGEINRHNH
jgi:predicted DNA-binding transcriptional regulator AlpA